MPEDDEAAEFLQAIYVELGGTLAGDTSAGSVRAADGGEAANDGETTAEKSVVVRLAVGAVGAAGPAESDGKIGPLSGWRIYTPDWVWEGTGLLFPDGMRIQLQAWREENATGGGGLRVRLAWQLDELSLAWPKRAASGEGLAWDQGDKVVDHIVVPLNKEYLSKRGVKGAGEALPQGLPLLTNFAELVLKLPRLAGKSHRSAVQLPAVLQVPADGVTGAASSQQQQPCTEVQTVEVRKFKGRNPFQLFGLVEWLDRAAAGGAAATSAVDIELVQRPVTATAQDAGGGAGGGGGAGSGAAVEYHLRARVVDRPRDVRAAQDDDTSGAHDGRREQ
ncbi:hypothetical protein HXX76_006333 [Chlamydomonas incerta]|uniref:Uncharacterized protein n=1 Tax=Chlamydomonas incerta TaxID=51695 RepID=A0A835W5V9_CHLIN|nr:hypothetical protein HXX76_006333 [Chlamydomonas incerta]|eukprot:KAG2436811.1 hypothetical protein HXX76_006333 [Chlamydomonas incerta]